MPKVKTQIAGIPTREKGQRSLDLYINRIIPPWIYPQWQNASFWRSVVRTIPVAMSCREQLISYQTSLEWKIEPRDSNMRDELKSEIRYYTDLFEGGGGHEDSGWDFVKLIEDILQDYLDIPFGGAAETIREGDKPDGKVLRIIPIDGATLFPTLRKDFPVGQQVLENPNHNIYFPAHAINRLYMSPRKEIRNEGWGMPPPEKIFLAMEMIRRGDLYYAKFMTDTPESGILDLIDMEEESAKDWVQSFQDLYAGIQPFKIPVLYEHTQKAEWIPFGKDPHATQFNETYHKYVTLICACYGITPTDIGFPSTGGGGGQTLAGSIRDERRTKRSGVAKIKKSTQYWFNRMLPPTLEFVWIDLDDEVSVALSRARLANATAMAQYVSSRIFTEKEGRLQTIADGLFSIPIPEDIPEGEFITPIEAKAPERPGMLGAPINPSSGGQGEVLNRSLFSDTLINALDISDVRIRKLAKAVVPIMAKEANLVVDQLSVDELGWYIDWHNKALWGNLDEEIPELVATTINTSSGAIKQIIDAEDWFDIPTQDVTRIVNELTNIYQRQRANFLVAKSYSEYEDNKRKDYLSEGDVEPDIEKVKQFKSQIRKEFRQFWSELDISKSIIAGVRNSIIRTGLVDLLDNQTQMGDNICVITNIREELAKYYNDTLAQFSRILEETINHNLEDDLNESM